MKQTRSSQNDVPTNQQNFDNPGILASTSPHYFFYVSTNVEIESRLDYGKSPKKIRVIFFTVMIEDFALEKCMVLDLTTSN